ncbi:hypothetical protein PYCCODRAFT_1429326 [Trametes coccinea BRFM310]|uniref:Uncharacterized protein n=1 Tax=Trametes coccinea (strain BRFM310) TaxID=1353009 RepID=A0A1Y2J4I0_TRAC3|nr:hypothetical protein PYCCODRAFT_1429326 [Trametes coccinea BRFM310]
MTACPLMLLMLAAAGFPLCLANGIVYPAAGDSLVAVQHHNVTWCVFLTSALRRVSLDSATAPGSLSTS